MIIHSLISEFNSTFNTYNVIHNRKDICALFLQKKKIFKIKFYTDCTILGQK